MAPCAAASTAFAKRAPAKAIESVALPVLFLAWMTSSPPNWMRCVSCSICAWSSCAAGCVRDTSGTIVVPEWPPTTGTWNLSASCGRPVTSATNVEARTRSSDVTPNRRLGSNTLCDLSTSANTGTRELTGFEMTSTNACGADLAMPSAMPYAIEALTLNRSSRVWPGLRAIPAGMMIRRASFTACARPSWSGRKPETGAGVLMCEMSFATPGAFTTSYSESSVTYGDCLSSSERGWPIPPAAPMTVTFIVHKSSWLNTGHGAPVGPYRRATYRSRDYAGAVWGPAEAASRASCRDGGVSRPSAAAGSLGCEKACWTCR